MKELLKKVLGKILEDKSIKKLYLQAQKKQDKQAVKRLNKQFNECLYTKKLEGYIYKTVTLSSKELYRKNSINREREISILNAPVGENEPEMVLILPDRSVNIEEIALKNICPEEFCTNTHLTMALRTLTEKQQLIIYLYYEKEIPLKKIAEYLNISQQAASKNEIAAINTLKKRLGGEHYGRAS